MKKRIISIALIIAMVVAMIPATLIPAFAAPYNGYDDGYDAFVSTTSPTLDGKMDAVYKNSEAVLVNNTHTKGADFATYFVVALDGLYVFSNINDSTVNVVAEAECGPGSGDKAQVYMQVSNTVSGSTTYASGYFDCDYAHDSSAQNSNVKSKSQIVAGGYTIEIFVPWSIWSILSGGVSLENTQVYVGFQVNNYTLEGTNTGLVYDNPATGSYWAQSYKSSNGAAPSNFMIPLNPITTTYEVATTTANSYKSFIANEAIILDGKCDDVYLRSQPITAGKVSVGVVGETTGFTTYIVAKDTGLYIFASICDDTLDKAEAVAGGLRAQDGDKFQLYLQFGSSIWNRWGYIDFDYVNGGRNLVTPKSTNGFDNTNKSAYVSDKIQQKAVIWDDNKGWDIEIFIPNSFCADAPSTKSSTATLKNLFCKVNFQVNNYTCTSWDANGKASEDEATIRHGLCYDVAGASESWSHNKNLVPVDFSVSPYRLAGSGAITYGYDVTVDGVKDDVYGDDSVAFVLDRETDGFTAKNGDPYGKAWVVVTKDRITAYAEFTDSTIAASSPGDAFDMFVYFPLTGTQTYAGYGYARDGHINTTSRWSSDAKLHTEGDANTSIGESFARKDLGDGKYAVEISMNLPKKERTALASGETIELGLALRHRDNATDGTAHYNRSCYESYWGNSSYNAVAFPTYSVSRLDNAANMTEEIKMTGAQVALGESITVNYYVKVPAYVITPVMKFTMNGKDTYVYGVPSGKLNEYQFAFEGIAPQHMGDNIKAELYIDGVYVTTKATYSVKENLTAVKNSANSALIEALLHYGAAAQQYTNYNTDALVNAGLTAPTYTTITNTDKVVGAANVNGIKMSAAGVNHSNVNRLYVKAGLTTNDPAVLGALVANLKVTIDGNEVAYAETDVPGVYIVYTDGIKVTDFDKVFTIEITDGTNTQTLTYSVNAYCAAKQNAENTETAALAKALYAYGVAAENYVA